MTCFSPPNTPTEPLLVRLLSATGRASLSEAEQRDVSRAATLAAAKAKRREAAGGDGSGEAVDDDEMEEKEEEGTGESDTGQGDEAAAAVAASRQTRKQELEAKRASEAASLVVGAEDLMRLDEGRMLFSRCAIFSVIF